MKIERIYHRWENWECYKAGFFENTPPEKITEEECQKMYAIFLSDLKRFKKAALRVISEWPNSCQHNLTNESMNRIAWIGQAAMCIETKIPSRFRGGYHLLSDSQKENADKVALEVLNYWMFLNGYGSYTMENVKSKTEANLY